MKLGFENTYKHPQKNLQKDLVVSAFSNLSQNFKIPP